MFLPFGPGHLLPAYAPPLVQLATVLVAVYVFYLIGLRADFKRYKLLAALSFAGALAADALGYLVATTGVSGTTYWIWGFGYVQSLGYPEPTGILDVLSAAVGSFLLPVAGFVMGQARREKGAQLIRAAFLLQSRRLSRFVPLS